MVRGPLSVLLAQINIRHALERRVRTSLTILGVAAGVALAVSISVINATLLSSVRSTARQLAGAAEIEVSGADKTGLHQRHVGVVQRIEGVERAVPVQRNFAAAKSGSESARLLVLGITPEITTLFPQRLGRFGEVRIQGGFGDGRGLLLSTHVGERLGLEPGDSVQLETPSGYEPVAVTGLLQSDALAVFNGGEAGFMLLPSAQARFDRPGRVDSIYVITDESADVAEVEARIEEALTGVAVVGPPGIRATGYTEALTGVNAITSAAATVALFVAGFLVFNTMSMSFAERKREIAMTLALGATRGQVFGAFLAEAAVFGMVAAAVGTAAGIGLARLLLDQAMEGLRVFDITAEGSLQVNLGHIVLGDLSGVAVALLGALVPARRVLKLAAVDSLRPRANIDARRGDESSRGRTVRVTAGVALMTASVAVLTFDPSDATDIEWLTNAGLLIGLTGLTLLLPSIVPAALDALRPLVVNVFRAPGRLAVDALRTSAARTTVTVGALVFTLGIAVGVASALRSFEVEWDRSAHMWFGAPLFVSPSSAGMLGADQPLPAGTERVLESVEGVHAAFPQRYRTVNIDGRQTVMYIVPAAQAVEDRARYAPDGQAYREHLARTLVTGDIAISRFMAERNGLEVGDSLAIPSPTGPVQVQVGDIFPDLNSLDSLYLDGDVFVEHWKDPRVDRFEITLEEGASPAEVSKGLDEVIQANALAAEVVTREELIGNMFDGIESLLTVARSIQLAALVVAALAIANTMLIAVHDRRWELGLQQAIGMGRAQMLRSLLLEAGIIGLVGGLGAALLGIGIAVMMLNGMTATYAFSIPFQPAWMLMALAVLVGAAIAAVVALYPSRVAVRAPIVESLRYE